jgi:NhaP-type Na+/H+ or K+/H+ antiporter
MSFNLWFIVAGTVFLLMALSASVLKKLPLTTTMLYLAFGFGIGPAGLALINFDPVEKSALLERLTEIAVIVSLFSAGLKLRTPLSDPLWRLPIRLAFGSMALTVGLVTVTGVFGLGLPVGAAVLLGAVLAPTDPVLASDVQIANPDDRDRLRFSLTGEAGLNDGTAFPFVMLGLGLLGLHDIGEFGWRWLAIDVFWAIGGGLGIGALLGTVVGYIVIYLRREHQEALGLDDFLALGLIAFSYGIALSANAYGFLSVFAAGLALRRIERQTSGGKPSEEVEETARAGKLQEIATDPEKAPVYMTQAVLGFTEQLERIGEITVVVIIGGVLSKAFLSIGDLWFIPVLFLIVRPISVAVGLLGSHSSPVQLKLISWFGIRGVGSLYYLTHALEHGVPEDVARRLTAITLSVITTSIIVHGISVTPLMRYYSKRHAS